MKHAYHTEIVASAPEAPGTSGLSWARVTMCNQNEDHMIWMMRVQSGGESQALVRLSDCWVETSVLQNLTKHIKAQLANKQHPASGGSDGVRSSSVLLTDFWFFLHCHTRSQSSNFRRERAACFPWGSGTLKDAITNTHTFVCSN